MEFWLTLLISFIVVITACKISFSYIDNSKKNSDSTLVRGVKSTIAGSFTVGAIFGCIGLGAPYMEHSNNTAASKSAMSDKSNLIPINNTKTIVVKEGTYTIYNDQSVTFIPKDKNY